MHVGFSGYDGDGGLGDSCLNAKKLIPGNS